MKRYIEIVYDNSGSMNEHILGRRKFEVAQELFEKEILPTIGLNGDQVVLRLLRTGCVNTLSNGETLPNQRSLMLDRIKRINHNQSTPLFYTIYDAVEACRNVRADDYLIFVLTDGDDTCNVKIEELIDEDIIRRYIQMMRVLLVQFAIDSPTSKNNLTAFASALGGQTISLDGSDTLPEMRTKLRVALNVSGFSNTFPLEHCFNNLPGFNLSWHEVENNGIDFHHAMLIYQKGLLSWLPDMKTSVSTLQFAELKFLYSLLFKTGLPEDLTKTMLAQLKKPFYYSFDCIYWDFGSAKWRYFLKQNRIQQMPNREAEDDDSPMDYSHDIFDINRTYYMEHNIYRVEYGQTNMISFQLVEEKSLKMDMFTKPDKVLMVGDRVIFRRS
jgi:hypothetical protein